MKAVVQRVSGAEVRINGQVISQIGVGLLVLIAAHREDSEAQAAKLSDRVLGLRIFNDQEGKMSLALAQVENAGILAVSNFTVYGETSKNRRPSFVEAAPFDKGKRLFNAFVASLRERCQHVQEGVFGAHMEVLLLNDGPVTVILEVPPG